MELLGDIIERNAGEGLGVIFIDQQRYVYAGDGQSMAGSTASGNSALLQGSVRTLHYDQSDGAEHMASPTLALTLRKQEFIPIHLRCQFDTIDLLLDNKETNCL